MKPNTTSTALGIALGIAAAVAASAPPPAHAASFWVGNGGAPPCTHATLQPAIDAAAGTVGGDTIYLVGAGPFAGPFHVPSGPLTIVGNVGSCGSPTSVGHATLRAASGARPLTVTAGANQTVRLRRLVVTTENGTYGGDGGAISFTGSAASSRLELADTRVEASTATGNGGGIHLAGGRLLVGEQARVTGNAATSGGGIAASDSAVVEVEGGSVDDNTALLDGGGIWAADGSLQLGSIASSLPTTVVDNVAGRDGGGLYVGGADPSFITSVEGRPPVAIAGNQAQRGGGLFVHGSYLSLDYAVVEQNHAAAEGGGVFVGGDGALVSNTLFVPTRGGFPRLARNTAAEGAAFHLDDAAVVLGSGRIHDHQAGAGAAVLAMVEQGLLFLSGVTLDGNQLPALFGIENHTLLQLEHLSLSGNSVGGFVRWRGNASEVSFDSSALDETEPFFASFESPGTPPRIACVVSRHASPFAVVPAGTDLSGLTVADPQFVAPPHDLHLRHTSPAIDRCGWTPRTDFDGDERSHDDVYHPNGVEQTADAGADETTVIFADAFESGDQGPWDGAAP